MIHQKRLTYSLLVGFIAASLVLATLLILARTTATLAAPTKNIAANKNTDSNAPSVTTIYTVTTTLDENDGTCQAPPAGDCSLRDAIILANASVGGDIIKFNIDTPGTLVITLTSALPSLTGGLITIDGYTQPGSSPADSDFAATIEISINGTLTSLKNGFNITSDHNTIRGLAIYHFDLAGISIWGSEDNVIAGNHIGIDRTGEITYPNGVGVIIGDQASNNVIGGSTNADRNVISGNLLHGIDIITSTLNTVSGNYIGLNGRGEDARGNGWSGVFIGNTSNQNTVGGDTSGERNIIAANGTNDVEIWGSGTTNNTISGNYIGVNRRGFGFDVYNANHGVYIYGGAQNNTIGGTTSKETNVISGHDGTINSCGVYLYGANTSGNTVSGNHIGVDDLGETPRPNTYGVAIAGGANHNTIGGDTAGEGNLISSNLINGVSLVDNGTAYNVVSGNIIGTNEAESEYLSNGIVGVFIANGAQHNTIGGDSNAEHNLISANTFDGVYINGSNTMSNTVAGNYIGTGLNGVPIVDLGNGWHGVRLDGGTKYNVIGGDSEGERNVISDNNRDGVRIVGSMTMSNTVVGNIIGLGSDGSTPGENYWYGVTITDGAKFNLIGGNTSGMGNIISENDYGGVLITGEQTEFNQVAGNIIGLAIDGATDNGNSGHGVEIRQGADFNMVGGDTPAERNILSGNFDDGVHIEGTGTMSNTISGNFIGTDISGTDSVGNSDNGVTIRDGAQYNHIGGDSAAERNIISGHTLDAGILISDTSNNIVSGNYIGLDVTGSSSLPNYDGIQVLDGATDNLIGGEQPSERNVISGNDHDGIYIAGDGTRGNQVLGNYIGTAQDSLAPLGNGEYGVFVEDGAQDNTIGPGNVIANNIAGIHILDATTLGIAVTQNSIYNNNAAGIYIYNNANGNIQNPNITCTAPGSVIVTGTACKSCLVELFGNPDTEEQEGRHYQGSNTADPSGHFTITVGGLLWPYLTATATDPISGTSEFSSIYTAENRQLFLPVMFR